MPRHADASAVRVTELQSERQVKGKVEQILALAGVVVMGRPAIPGAFSGAKYPVRGLKSSVELPGSPPAEPVAALVLKGPCCRALRAPLLTAG